MDRLLSMRVFQRVVDEGSFSAAARALDLSPAVVTRLVADLEEHLGSRLLQRSTRRLALTDAGEAYLERLRHILQDIDDADAIISTHTQQLAGVLHISASPVLAVHVLAPLIAGFRQLYPQIVFDVDVDPAGTQSVEDHDVTLMSSLAGLEPHVIARRIATTEAILVAAPDYLRLRGAIHEPQDLLHHDCLRLRIPGVRTGPIKLMRDDPPGTVEEVDVNAVMWVNHTDTLMRAALDGAGITSTSLDLAAPHLASGELVRILRPWITGRLSLYAALPSRKFMPRRTRVFLDYLTEQTQSMLLRAAART